ncbi:MAG: choice-of-anchor X domain-containing protein, partial [Candidatus Neomarinimicrobiota bacterium]
MKKALTLVIVMFCFAALLFGGSWETVKVNSFEMEVDRAMCTSFVDANTGWIGFSTTYPTDKMGWIMKTIDGGASWTTVREPDVTAIAWNDMEFIDANVGYACGDAGVIYKTVNGGTDWTMIGDTVTYKVDLYDLDVVSANVVYIAGKDNTLLKTTNGTAFTKLSYNFDGDFTIVDATRDDLDGGIAFFDENRGVVAVDFTKEATIWWTENGGTTWNPVKITASFPTTATSYRVYDVAAGGDSTVALACYYHVCLVSTNGGRSFSVKGPYSTSNVSSSYVEVLDNNKIFTGGGSDNFFMKTTDGGVNWDTLYTGTGQTQSAADFIDANTGFVFANGNQFFKTTNGGTTWTNLNEWPGVSLFGLAFPDENTIVATATSGGEMTISSDGGTTWSYPDNLKTGLDSDIFECEFINANNGLMGGTGGNLIKTTDGGATFTAISNPMYDNNKAINAMHYLNGDTVFIGGGSGYVCYSFDGGGTWTKATAGSKTVYDIWPLAGNQVVTTCASGEYYTSTDSKIFTKLGATSPTSNLRAVKFRNGIGIIPASAGNIFRTAGWNVLPTLVYTASNGAELYDVEFVDDNTIYVVGQYGTILKSSDAGLNWTVETSPTTEVLQKVRYDGGALWAVGQNGTVLKNQIVLTPEVNVTFLANTAGVPDTLWESSTVQVRGQWPFTWGADSPHIMSSESGDYWAYTVTFPRDSLNKTIEYKFCTFPVAPGDLTGEMNGWESANNRVLDLRTFTGSDTTLPLQYVDGWKAGGDYQQFDKPFETTDSIDVFLRVDMEALIKSASFNPATEYVGVRGSNAWGDWSGVPSFNWNATHQFMPENVHANGIWGSTYNGTYFWNGVLHLPASWAGTEIQYKFIIGDAWGRNEDNNRSFVLPADGSDVTVHWVWYNDAPPAGFSGNDTTDITFYADLSKAVANNGFEVGDTLLVRYGYFGSSVEVKTETMLRVPGEIQYYTTVEDVPVVFSKPLYYQYYMVKGGVEQREVYFNFDYTGAVPSEAERRAYEVNSVTEVIQDNVNSDVDARRMPIFRNNRLLSKAMTLTVECDLRPAYYQVWAGSTLDDIQAGVDITPTLLATYPDTLARLGLFINGPMSNNGEGTWATWGGTLAGDVNRKMYDDGTNGDATANDTIYTVVYSFTTSQRVGQEFKFGIGGGDNESGYGLNHIENIDDTNPTYTMQVQWGSINPKFYSAWDYDNRQPANGVKDEALPIVTRFALEQ